MQSEKTQLQRQLTQARRELELAAEKEQLLSRQNHLRSKEAAELQARVRALEGTVAELVRQGEREKEAVVLRAKQQVRARDAVAGDVKSQWRTRGGANSNAGRCGGGGAPRGAGRRCGGRWSPGPVAAPGRVRRLAVASIAIAPRRITPAGPARPPAPLAACDRRWRRVSWSCPVCGS